MNSVQMKVAESIAALGPQVHDKIVGVMVDREAERRSSAMVKVIDKLEGFEKDLLKLKPDGATYDEKGNKITEYYSKQRTDERKKLGDKIAKWTAGINKALESNDYAKVYEFASGNEKPDRNEDSGENAESTS